MGNRGLFCLIIKRFGKAVVFKVFNIDIGAGKHINTKYKCRKR